MLSGETTIVHLHMLFSASYTSTITILNSQQMIGKKLQIITYNINYKSNISY